MKVLILDFMVRRKLCVFSLVRKNFHNKVLHQFKKLVSTKFPKLRFKIQGRGLQNSYLNRSLVNILYCYLYNYCIKDSIK